MTKTRSQWKCWKKPCNVKLRKSWYVIANDNSTVTLLSKDSFGNKALYTADGLSVTKKKGAGEYWWLRSPGTYALDAAYVIGGSGDVDVYGFPVDTEIGVRPALKLNLSSVIFSSESNAFSLPVPVTGVTLNPSTAQTITVGDKVPFTASIEPAGAEKEFSLTVKAGEETGPEPGPKPEPGPGPEPSAEIQTDSTLPEAKPDEEFDSCIIKIY